MAKKVAPQDECRHPMTQRTWKGTELICNPCGKVLTTRPPEEVVIDQEIDIFAAAPVIDTDMACSMDNVCVDKGADCREKGRIDRENACFNDGKGEITADDVRLPGDTLEVYQEPPPESIGEDGVKEGEDGNASESIPAVPETFSAGGHKTFPRTLSVSLSEEELAEQGAEMSRLIGIWTKAKMQKKAYDQASKKLIDEAEEKYVAIAEAVEAGSEEREVLCYTVYDAEHGLKKTYRCDTGDVVEEVNMELLDYEHCPDYQTEQSIRNVEETIGKEGEGEEQEAAPGEESVGEVAETEIGEGDMTLKEEIDAPEPNLEVGEEQEADEMDLTDESPFKDDAEWPELPGQAA
jgi:hypothetical protein